MTTPPRATEKTRRDLSPTWPLVNLCEECYAVSVNEDEKYCRRCVEVIANRAVMEHEEERWAFYRHVVIVIGIVLIGLAVSTWMSW